MVCSATGRISPNPDVRAQQQLLYPVSTDIGFTCSIFCSFLFMNHLTRSMSFYSPQTARKQRLGRAHKHPRFLANHQLRRSNRDGRIQLKLSKGLAPKVARPRMNLLILRTKRHYRTSCEVHARRAGISVVAELDTIAPEIGSANNLIQDIDIAIGNI